MEHLFNTKYGVKIIWKAGGVDFPRFRKGGSDWNNDIEGIPTVYQKKKATELYKAVSKHATTYRGRGIERVELVSATDLLR